MSTRITHMCVSVRGAIRNWRDWAGSITGDDGKRLMTKHEIQNALMDELAKGHEVIPLGNPCEGFDYSGGGCPGHSVEAET